MNERFTLLRSQATAPAGLIDYEPHALRRDAVVLDAKSGRALGAAYPRSGFEFGFATEDVGAA